MVLTNKLQPGINISGKENSLLLRLKRGGGVSYAEAHLEY